MRLGLIGLPLSGKTTVFNALTGAHSAYADGHAHIATVAVPDDRLDVLQKIFEPKKVVPPGGSIRLCLTVETDKVPKGRRYEVELEVVGRLGSTGAGEEVRARLLLQVDPG